MDFFILMYSECQIQEATVPAFQITELVYINFRSSKFTYIKKLFTKIHKIKH